jgi:hypothetical protein
MAEANRSKGNLRLSVAVVLLFSLATVVACSASLGAESVSSAPTSTVSSADCNSSTATNSSTLFLFVTAAGSPVEGVKVTAGNISEVTNSSGLAVVGGGNFDNFSVDYLNQSVPVSLRGHQFPIICEGSSYHRVVSMVITTSAVPEEDESRR